MPSEAPFKAWTLKREADVLCGKSHWFIQGTNYQHSWKISFQIHQNANKHFEDALFNFPICLPARGSWQPYL